jgi:mannose-1-phosphate guanylyltransferase
MRTRSGGLWSIVLAGGEGERTRAFIESWLGYSRPKQYCAFVGTRSLFQHTVDRADALSSGERRVVIAAASHRGYVDEQLRGRERGKVILQPRNCGTAAGIFLGLAYVLAQDPDATVVIYPSDHFVYPESAFLVAVRKAVRIARRYPRPVLLGVRPSHSEADYGWIVPSAAVEDGAARRVESFIEKPPPFQAEEVLRKGALLNTFIVVSKLAPLWALGFRALPEMMPAFVRFRNVLRPGGEDPELEAMYRDLDSRDFSSDVLQRAPREFCVLELNGVWWSDWGRPERILSTLCALGKEAPFPGAFPFTTLDGELAVHPQRIERLASSP